MCLAIMPIFSLHSDILNIQAASGIYNFTQSNIAFHF